MISHEYPKIALLFLDTHCSKFHFKLLETIVIIRIVIKGLDNFFTFRNQSRTIKIIGIDTIESLLKI